MRVLIVRWLVMMAVVGIACGGARGQEAKPFVSQGKLFDAQDKPVLTD